MGAFVLVLSIASIAHMTRTRGRSPWIYSLIAPMGWFVSVVLAGWILPSEGSQPGLQSAIATAVGNLAPWAWLGLVAVFIRFTDGRNTPVSICLRS